MSADSTVITRSGVAASRGPTAPGMKSQAWTTTWQTGCTDGTRVRGILCSVAPSRSSMGVLRGGCWDGLATALIAIIGPGRPRHHDRLPLFLARDSPETMPRYATHSTRLPPSATAVELRRWGATHRRVRYAWGPRFLHTAEVTGSIPVTPTSTNSLPHPQLDAHCQQIVSKSLRVARRHTPGGRLAAREATGRTRRSGPGRRSP